MTAIFPPIQTKNSVNTEHTTDDLFLKQKINSVQSAITNVSVQLAQITKWSNEIKNVLKTLTDTQTEIKSDALSTQTEGVIFKATLAEIKEDIITSLNSFDNKISKINNVIETVKNTAANNQVELSDNIFTTLDSILKQITIVNSECANIPASFEKILSDNDEKTYSLLQNIFEQIKDDRTILSSVGKNIVILNSNILNLTQRINEIEKYVYHSEYWYGKNEITNSFDRESMTGWLMTAAPDKFGEPVLISNENNESYAIRNIFITSANMANKLYKIRFYSSESDSFSDATILSEALYIKVGNLLNSIPIVVSSPLISKNSKLWCAIKCEAPTATLSLLISI